jgi:hypothetical protein
MITLGVHSFGPEVRDTLFSEAIMQTMRAFVKVRSADYNDGTLPWVNPIYIIPGSLGSADFECMKLGYFSMKKKGCVVMIAVPPEIALSTSPEEYIVNSLKDAIGLAAKKFQKKGLAFDIDKANSLIDLAMAQQDLNMVT